MPFVTNLRLVRDRRAFSQVDLAKRSGVAQRSISELENGQRSARPSTVRKLAKALKVDPAELMGDQDAVA